MVQFSIDSFILSNGSNPAAYGTGQVGGEMPSFCG